MNDDEKAIDQNYLSPFEWMGKKRTLGRTTMRTKRDIKQLYNVDPSKLPDAAFDEHMGKLRKVLDLLIKPKLTAEEFESMDDADLGEVVHKIKVRDLQREKYTIEEAESLIATERKMNVAAAENADFRKLIQNAEEETNPDVKESEKVKDTG
ncbi:MAG: hypothetical protein K8E24_016150 [Methanobacterium paludis]|nr:hypothetical protein [Methanobacterium paludis]